MTAISGYSLTLVGASLGNFPGIKSVNVGGLELTIDEILCVDDTNRVPEKLPMVVKEGAMEIVFKYTKTIYATLRAAALAVTQDTFTLTDSQSSTHAGAGYVTKVGGKNLDTSGHAQFSVTLTPVTVWTFTAGA